MTARLPPKSQHYQPLPSRTVHAMRVARAASFALGLIALSLGAGTAGYHFIGSLGWLDAEYNAAMILTGMGPVDPMRTDAAKIFASGYALFSGVAFLSSVGLFVSPFVQRFLHRMHLEIERNEK